MAAGRGILSKLVVTGHSVEDKYATESATFIRRSQVEYFFDVF